MKENRGDMALRMNRKRETASELEAIANSSSDGYWVRAEQGSPVSGRSPSVSKAEDCAEDKSDASLPRRLDLEGIESAMERLQHELEEQEAIKDRFIRHLQELQQLESESRRVVAKSPSMLKLLRQALKAASVYTSVLIRGEAGTGKGLVADLIHKNSRRCNGPRIKINCSYIPESLIESELFGYRNGAFSEAQSGGKTGYIELAEGGTLFLDEISELPLSSQFKLLRFLEEGQLMRLGESSSRSASVRILAATDRDLGELARKGLFNPDLYRHLEVVSLQLPALRERTDCLPYLIRHYIDLFADKHGVKRRLSRHASEALLAHPYPGNVRELRGICERVVVMSESELIQLSDLPGDIARRFEKNQHLPGNWVEGMSLEQILDDMERTVLGQAMAKYCNQSKAAAALSVSQPTIARKLNKYGMSGKA